MLAEDATRTYLEGHPTRMASHPMAAGVIYHGSAVIVNRTAGQDGLAGPLTFNAEHVFVGFAEEHAEASEDGERRVRCRSTGVIRVPISGGVVPEDLGRQIYLDDDFESFTKAPANAVRVGRVASVNVDQSYMDIAFNSEAYE
ncbi:MAG: hypothetical protein AAF196_02985 [Planctomycetota bacterium]